MIEKLKDQESKSITKMEDIEKLVNKMIQDKMNNELKERYQIGFLIDLQM